MKEVRIMATQITIQGNIGAWDTEGAQQLRKTKAGTSAINFSVAHDHRVQDAQGVWSSKSVSWYTVAIFGPGAENAFRMFGKGTPLVVTGNVEIVVYTNPSTGAVTTTAQIVASDFGVNLKYAPKVAQTELVVEEPAH